MAVYDLSEQRLCVRIVYDGVAGAGKTTNLRQLCSLFATQRTTELYSPAEVRGRTLYFDWVRISAGVVCGFPLLCQVISVPGQVVLTERRRHLLATADVVVYVSDSSKSALERAREGMDVLDRVARERGEPIPLVIQANKQDQKNAVDGAAVQKALGKPDAAIVEGIATDGIGVVDTFVTAVRTLAKTIQSRSEQKGMRIRVERAETPAEVLSRLKQAKVDPEWAAEMALEEAAAAFMFGDGRGFVEAVELEQGAAASDASAGARAVPEKVPEAVLPNAEVPTGYIWPAHTGRTTLRMLQRDGKLDQKVRLDSAGKAELIVGNYVLRTSLEERYPGDEAARQALVRSARERAQKSTNGDAVLVLQSGPDGSCWLWTVSSRKPQAGAEMSAVSESA